MKRLIAASMLVLLLSVCEPALAADVTGLYVAPKLLWSYQYHGDAKFTSDTSDIGSSNKHADAWGGALAVGYDFMPKFAWPIRTELEYAVRSQTKTSHSPYRDWSGDGYYASQYNNSRKMSISSLFANVFYDIKTGTKFTPYVGGGIGVAEIQVKDNFSEEFADGSFGPYNYTGSSRKTVTNFAWNVGAGVAYSFDNNWSLDLGYRYCDFGKVKGAEAVGSTDGGTGGYRYQAKSNVTAHEVALGVRYTF